jgi:hypothetical protein
MGPDPEALERLMHEREGVPPVDDEPVDVSPGEQPASPDEVDDDDGEVD